MTQVLEIDNVITKIKNGEITYDQVYNAELEMSQRIAIDYYKDHLNDNLEKNQKLNMLFGDIECYSYNSGEFEPDKAVSPITAFTFYTTKDKTYHCFFLTLPINHQKFTQIMVPSIEEMFMKDLKNQKYTYKNKEFQYVEDDENIKIYLYNSEKLMLEDCWKLIHKIDPVLLSGAYFDTFDMPYIHNRMIRLFEDERKVSKIISKFNVVKIRKMDNKVLVQIIEYPILDMVHLYKPRSEGGLIISSLEIFLIQ